jgi:hypothetical protein
MLVFLFAACNSEKKESSLDETHDRLTKIAIQQGNQIAKKAKKALGGKLKEAIQDSGTVYAIRFCNTAAYPILDTLSTTLPVNIRRVSNKYRNTADKPDSLEKTALGLFHVQFSSGQSLQPIVKISGEYVHYYKPIMLDNPICLNCHGKVGSQINLKTHEAIMEYYPNDKATSYELNDLRGMWSLTFERRKIMAYLKAQEK